MAHGFLTPTPVGENDLFKTIGDFLKNFKDRGDKNGDAPEGGSNLAVVEKFGKADIYKEPRISNEKEEKQASLLVSRMGGVLANMMNRSDPKEEQSVGGVRKGGSFVNMGASTKPISDTTFFRSAVVEGINPLTGEYYSPEERVAAFKKYRPNERTTQGVGVSGGSGADIVAALALNTAAVIRMENAVNRQTENDTRISSKEIQARDTMFNKLLASRKEERLEQGGDFSGNISPLAVGAGGAGGSGGFGMGGRGGGRNPALQRLDTFQTLAKSGTNLKGMQQIGNVGKNIGKSARAAGNVIGTVSQKAGKLLKTSPNALKSIFNAAVVKGTKSLLPKSLFDAIKAQSAMGILGKGSAFEQLGNFFRYGSATDPLYAKGADAARKAKGLSILDNLVGAPPIGAKPGGMQAANFLQGDAFESMQKVGKGIFSPIGSAESAMTAQKIVYGDAAQAAASRIALASAGEKAIKSADLAKDAIIKKGVKNGLTRGSGLTRLMVKNLGKSGTRSVLKQIPVVAGVAGIIFGIQRALEGDFVGAGLEVASGLLGATGTTPGVGLAIDGFLLGRDLGMMPMAKGGIHSGILSSATPFLNSNILAGEKGKEAFLPLEGAEGEIAGSVFGQATAESLANFFFRQTKGSDAIKKLRYNSDHPMGTEQPNPHPRGTILHKQFERLRQMNIIDPDMQISSANPNSYNPIENPNGMMISRTSAEVAMGDRMNNSTTTVVMQPAPSQDGKTSSGIPMTTNSAGGTGDQGLSLYSSLGITLAV